MAVGVAGTEAVAAAAESWDQAWMHQVAVDIVLGTADVDIGGQDWGRGDAEMAKVASCDSSHED